MSFACTRRHQSYASFRLEVFLSLFTPSSGRISIASSPNLRSHRRDGRTQDRCFRSPAKLSKQRGSRNVNEDTELRAFTEGRFVRDDDQSPSWNSARNDDISASQLDTSTRAGVDSPLSSKGQSDWTCSSCDFSNFRRYTICAKCSAPAPGPIAVPSRLQVPDPSATSESTRRSRPWTPYSSRGQEDLKALVQDLKKAACKAGQFAEEVHGTTTKDTKTVKLDLDESQIDGSAQRTRRIKPDSEEKSWSGIKRLSLDLPESPLMRRLGKEKPHKREATDEEWSALLNNPWACILASPVRYCQGTGVRLPRDLMVPWGFIKRHANDATYLMPYELADMKTLRTAGYYEKSVLEASEDMDESEAKEKSSQAKPLPPDFNAESLSRQSTKVVGMEGKTTILAYQPLIEKLTSRIIRQDNGATVRGAVKRLLSHRIKASFKEAQHYAKDAEERTEMDLNSLQWQPDIAGRMRNIMRERVLSALEALGLSNENGKIIEPVPPKALKTGRIAAAFGPAKNEDVGALKYTFKVANSESEPSPRIPHKKLRQLIINTFAGSFMLHVNAPPVMIPDQPSPILSDQAPNLLPQTISLNNTIRLPVFNLHQLMGFRDGVASKHMALRYKQVLRCSKILSALKLNSNPIHHETVSSKGRGEQPLSQSVRDSKNDPAYLLLISCRSPKATIFARELWQLWRYQGGTAQESEMATITTNVLKALEESVEAAEDEVENPDEEHGLKR